MQDNLLITLSGIKPLKTAIQNFPQQPSWHLQKRIYHQLWATQLSRPLSRISGETI